MPQSLAGTGSALFRHRPFTAWDEGNSGSRRQLYSMGPMLIRLLTLQLASSQLPCTWWFAGQFPIYPLQPKLQIPKPIQTTKKVPDSSQLPLNKLHLHRPQIGTNKLMITPAGTSSSTTQRAPQKEPFGHGSKARTPSEHPNLH